ncbi:AAA family ATPase [Holophaga foetida]|uniref:AAA family ATPase n=1 Tax=Holophaga foetida TaxID=35839 RepID=UPI0002472140|nr:AAA family ATPase [Holophaga foetida]
MKPLTLSLQNFGPYAGPELTIDFAHLDRLFLIAGDTGAGKTSLFDAISYGLYGKPLGTRSETTLRSQFADETGSCVVSFTFETLTEQFQVTRSPYWVEKKERGGGFKKPSTRLAAFRRPRTGGEWEKLAEGKAGDINDALQAAVGFSHAEFSKLVVLPQGQFQQFLEMESAKREELLKQLFPVEDHEALAALAQVRAKGLEEEEKALVERQNEVRRDFDPDESAERLAGLEAGLADASERSRGADIAHQSAFQALTEGRLRQGQFQNLEVQRAREASLEAQGAARELDRVRLADHQRGLQVRSVLDQTEGAEGDRERLEKALRELQGEVEEADARLARAREACAGLGDAREALEARREEGRALERRKQGLMELAAANRGLAGLEQALQAAGEDHKRVQAEHQLLLEEQKGLEQAAEVIRELQVRRDSLRTEAEPLSLLEKDARRLGEMRAEELPRLRRKLEEAQGEARRAVLELQEAEGQLRASEVARDQARAADLASSLAPGEPCPVCGSLEHPAPALFHGDGLAELLDARRELVEARRKRVVDTERLGGVAAHSLGQGEADASTLARSLEEAGFVSPEALLERLQVLREDYKALVRQLKPLEEAQRGRGELQTRLQEVAQRVENLQAKRQETQQALALRSGERQRIFLEAGSPEDPLQALGDLEARAQALACGIREEAARLDALESELREGEKALALRQAEQAQKSRDLGTLVERIQGLEQALRTALAASAFPDRAAVRLALLEERERATLAKVLGDYDQALSATRGAIASLEKEVEGLTPPDLEELERVETAARGERDAAQASRQGAQASLEAHRKAAGRWAELQEAWKELKARGAIFLELSQDLNGAGKEGRPKLSFSSFVLGRWLAQVLEQGSRRLSVLSGGRYRFVHNDGVSDARKRAGLEIDVHDSHAGGQRSVGTLSGGEKFLASLSLALGLSDVIQASAGGRRLDALFIDEGFGSLDGDSLDRAIAVLEEIGEGRQVGVISHVESLKKTIPSQIRVEKGPAGSKVEVA